MHGHSHAGHSHSHAPADFGRAYFIGVLLNSLFVGAEFVFGFLSGSLSLVADAGHNLSDVLSLLLAWGATVLAGREPSTRYTYGLRRSTILAALFNAVLLFVTVGGIAWEAIHRLLKPEPVAPITVMIVAAVGVLVNTITAMLFFRGRESDLNVRGAFLHLASDAIVSLGVVAAGLIILRTGWVWIDTLVSLIIVVAIVLGTWGLFKDSMLLSLDAVPAHLQFEDVQAYLESVTGTGTVRDLHIWAMSTTEAALTARIQIREGGSLNQLDSLRTEIETGLHDRFELHHTTIQFEQAENDAVCAVANLPGPASAA